MDTEITLVSFRYLYCNQIEFQFSVGEDLTVKMLQQSLSIRHENISGYSVREEGGETFAAIIDLAGDLADPNIGVSYFLGN